MNWNEQENMLVKDFELNDFKEAISFVNKVADICNEVDHHPDILVNDWNKVRIITTTHDEGNKITDKDKELTEKIDSLE